MAAVALAQVQLLAESAWDKVRSTPSCPAVAVSAIHKSPVTEWQRCSILGDTGHVRCQFFERTDFQSPSALGPAVAPIGILPPLSPSLGTNQISQLSEPEKLCLSNRSTAMSTGSYGVHSYY